MTEKVVEFERRHSDVLDRLRFRKVPLDACYQCLRCSSGCPMLSFMDVAPHRLIRWLQYGLEDQVLRSRTIWLCASCQTCTTRCPNQVEMAHLMDLLRQEAVRRGVPCPESDVQRFHQTFVEEIKRGRVHELSLIARFKLATRRFADDLKIGWQMFRRGRIKIWPRRAAGAAEVKRIFRQAEGEE